MDEFVGWGQQAEPEGGEVLDHKGFSIPDRRI